jgi:hypothetical protein
VPVAAAVTLRVACGLFNNQAARSVEMGARVALGISSRRRGSHFLACARSIIFSCSRPSRRDVRQSCGDWRGPGRGASAARPDDRVPGIDISRADGEFLHGSESMSTEEQGIESGICPA